MTRSSSAWPSDASVSFLSDILEAAPPIEVLFEPEGVRWDPTPSREKRKELAAAAGRSPACAGFKYSAGIGASSVGFDEENSNTLTADWHAPAVFPINEQVATRDKKLGRGTCLGVVESGDQGFTILANHPHMVGDCRDFQHPITMADLNANTAIGYDMVGTLKVGGDAPSVCL